jgi:hypothetical protein
MDARNFSGGNEVGSDVKSRYAWNKSMSFQITATIVVGILLGGELFVLTLQWYVCFPHSSYCIHRLSDRFVPPPCQMEPKRPQWHPGRCAYHLCVLLHHFYRRRTRKEIKVQCAAKQTVLEDGSVRFCRSEEENIRAGSRVEEYTMGRGTAIRSRLAVFKVKWMYAISKQWLLEIVIEYR